MGKLSSALKYCIHFFCLLCAASFLLCGLIFICDNQTLNILAPLGWSCLQYTLFFAVIYSCTLCFFFFIFRLIPQNNKKRNLLLYLCAGLLCALIAFSTPYAPSNDSSEMHDVLKHLLEHGTLSAYQGAYSRFFLTNKFAVCFYYPLVKLFHHVYWGVKITNLFCLFITIGMTAGAAGRFFGSGYAKKSFLILAVFAPYMLLSGPYIYLPSMMLASTGLFFYLSGKLPVRIFSYFVMAVLFLMRPTALGFILIFIFVRALFCLHEKKKFLSGIFSLFLLLCVCFFVKAGAGIFAYHSGFHIYPQLNNSASLWTLELGTRPQSEDTGTCTYSALSPPETLHEDEITQDFNRLWYLYFQDDPSTYDEVRSIQSDLKTKLLLRAKTEIMDSPAHFGQFLKTKAVNFFSDRYKGYYYAANIYSPSFEKELYQNYQFKYFAYENMILFLFAVSSLLCAAGGILGLRKKHEKSHPTAALFSFGAMITALIFILLTEVSKKYICDFYIPMMIVICHSIITVCGALNRRLKTAFAIMKEKRYAFFRAILPCMLILLSSAVLISIYNLGNFDALKGAQTTVSDLAQPDENNCTKLLTIDFSHPITEDGYFIQNGTDEKISLSGKSRIQIPFQETDWFSIFVIPPYEAKIKDESEKGITYTPPYLRPFDIRFVNYYPDET